MKAVPESKLEQTGFHLEMRVAAQAQAMRADVRQAEHYISLDDPAGAKVREIDVLAEWEHAGDSRRTRVMAVVECKAHEGSWVTFDAGAGREERNTHSLFDLLPTEHFGNGDWIKPKLEWLMLGGTTGTLLQETLLTYKIIDPFKTKGREDAAGQVACRPCPGGDSAGAAVMAIPLGLKRRTVRGMIGRLKRLLRRHDWERHSNPETPGKDAVFDLCRRCNEERNEWKDYDAEAIGRITPDMGG